MIIAVDTNVLLDILLQDPAYCESSKATLTEALKRGTLIISEVVYAELASQFVDEEEEDKLEEFLEDLRIVLKPSNRDVLRAAARAWKAYTARRREELQCPQCGHKSLVRCERCSSVVTTRQHIISDFLIGAHAQVFAGALLSRDRGYYRTYFRDLPLFTVEQEQSED